MHDADGVRLVQRLDLVDEIFRQHRMGRQQVSPALRVERPRKDHAGTELLHGNLSDGRAACFWK